MADQSKAANQNKAPVSEAEVLRNINTTEEYIQSHPEELVSHLYNAMNGLSKTYLAYKNANGAEGWATSIENTEGKPMWTSDQASQLEEELPGLVQQISKEFDETSEEVKQEGGSEASSDPTLHVTAESSLVTLPVVSTFSLDEMFYSLKSYLKSLDDKNRELAAVLGPVALVKRFSNNFQEDPVIAGPYPAYDIPAIKFPSRWIIPAISTILETCRTLVSNRYVDVESLRKILSIVLAVFDVSRGEWKQGVLNLMGYFGQDSMKIGKTLLMYRWVYNFISPDIQERLEEDLYAASKSLIIGAFLWIASMVSPTSVRNTINEMLESTKVAWENLNKERAGIEARVQESAAKVGATVVFPELPIKQFPSFDDIQNFQSLVHQPEVLCSKEFQESLALALQVPVLRFVLELMNIPTVPEKLQEICRDQPSSVTEAFLKAYTPIVTIDKESTKESTEEPTKESKKSQKGGRLKLKR